MLPALKSCAEKLTSKAKRCPPWFLPRRTPPLPRSFLSTPLRTQPTEPQLPGAPIYPQDWPEAEENFPRALLKSAPVRRSKRHSAVTGRFPVVRSAPVSSCMTGIGLRIAYAIPGGTGNDAALHEPLQSGLEICEEGVAVNALDDFRDFTGSVAARDCHIVHTGRVHSHPAGSSDRRGGFPADQRSKGGLAASNGGETACRREPVCREVGNEVRF
jgi:hypothetical protein